MGGRGGRQAPSKVMEQIDEERGIAIWLLSLMVTYELRRLLSNPGVGINEEHRCVARVSAPSVDVRLETLARSVSERKQCGA
eukprot:s472_g4.t1